MIMELLIPVGILGAMGLIFGAGLAIASKVFEVKTDERVPLVRDALPGANCGGCGFPGCDALAAAIVNGEAAVNACPVGGAATAMAIPETVFITTISVAICRDTKPSCNTRVYLSVMPLSGLAREIYFWRPLWPATLDSFSSLISRDMVA